MPVNMRIHGFGPSGDCVYLIELPMIPEHDVSALIHTCRQHARFQGATRVTVHIGE